MPNTYTLAALTKDQIKEGWQNAEEVIDDNIPRKDENGEEANENGHGTAVAAVAGGYTYGVARDANLYLIKMRNFYVNAKDGSKKRAEPYMTAFTDAFQRIYDAVTAKGPLGGIDPTKSVINLSLGKLSS